MIVLTSLSHTVAQSNQIGCADNGLICRLCTMLSAGLSDTSHSDDDDASSMSEVVDAVVIGGADADVVVVEDEEEAVDAGSRRRLDEYFRPREDAELLALSAKWDRIATRRPLTPLEEGQKDAELAEAAVRLKDRERRLLRHSHTNNNNSNSHRRRRLAVEEADEDNNAFGPRGRVSSLADLNNGKRQRRLDDFVDVGDALSAAKPPQKHSLSSSSSSSRRTATKSHHEHEKGDIIIAHHSDPLKRHHSASSNSTYTSTKSIPTRLTDFYEPLADTADYRETIDFDLRPKQRKKKKNEHRIIREISPETDKRYRAADRILFNASLMVICAESSGHSLTRVRLELMKFLSGARKDPPYPLDVADMLI